MNNEWNYIWLARQVDDLENMCNRMVTVGDRVGKETLQHTDIAEMRLHQTDIEWALCEGFNAEIRALLGFESSREEWADRAHRLLSKIPKMSEVYLLGSIPGSYTYGTYLQAKALLNGDLDALRQQIEERCGQEAQQQ